MSTDAHVAMVVEECFVEHRDDGEFAYDSRDVPYSVIAPRSGSAPIIFTTKPRLVAPALDACGAPGAGLIGRYGLPSAADLVWIRELTGPRKLLFLGDCDPVDLMIFAWFRAQLGLEGVGHLGVNDAFLRGLEPTPLESLTLPCSAAEVSAMAQLQIVLQDSYAILGPRCSSILAQQGKVELDAVLFANGRFT